MLQTAVQKLLLMCFVQINFLKTEQMTIKVKVLKRIMTLTLILMINCCALYKTVVKLQKKPIYLVENQGFT